MEQKPEWPKCSMLKELVALRQSQSRSCNRFSRKDHWNRWYNAVQIASGEKKEARVAKAQKGNSVLLQLHVSLNPIHGKAMIEGVEAGTAIDVTTLNQATQSLSQQFQKQRGSGCSEQHGFAVTISRSKALWTRTRFYGQLVLSVLKGTHGWSIGGDTITVKNLKCFK